LAITRPTWVPNGIALSRRSAGAELGDNRALFPGRKDQTEHREDPLLLERKVALAERSQPLGVIDAQVLQRCKAGVATTLDVVECTVKGATCPGFTSCADAEAAAIAAMGCTPPDPDPMPLEPTPEPGPLPGPRPVPAPVARR
jgi:hypothetical protein